jgi:hypothetical protein
MTLTPGCSRSHRAKVSAVRSGRSATGRRRSRSISTVPYVWRFRSAKASTPRTVGRGRDGAGCLRSRRSSVFRLTSRAHWWPSCSPAVPPQGHTQGDQALGQPQRAPGPGSRHGRQPFGEDAATAAGIAAKPFADPQLEVHTVLRPGQISQSAFIVTVDMMRRGGAQRTRCRSLGRAHAQGDLGRGVINRPRLKAQERGIRYQAGKDSRGWCRDESGLLLPSRMSLGQREVCIPTASG